MFVELTQTQSFFFFFAGMGSRAVLGLSLIRNWISVEDDRSALLKNVCALDCVVPCILRKLNCFKRANILTFEYIISVE